ncbi:MAG: amidohydrolase family protein [Deinococcales bacterium]|nr:amidohydrolase family protein [Deinococcales bacterium]
MPVRPVGEVVGAPGAERVLLHAEVVYDGIGLPRPDAAVLLQAREGGYWLSDVRDHAATARTFPEARAVDGGFAVSPPVVNAHTHLDLSDMAFEASPYAAFMERVIAHGRAGGRGLAAAERGIAELKRHGVTVVGDIVTDPAVMRRLLEDPDLTGVAYWEVIGLRDEEADERFEEARRLVAGFRALERPGGVRVGLSPHTPHTVAPRLLQRLAAWARVEGLPLAIHVAESPLENDFHLHGRGALAEWLAAFGASVAPSGVSPVRYLYDLGVLEAAPTLVHMVNVSEEDVRLVARAGSVVVHCPRSNAALGCGTFPWQLYAKHSVEVAFGTDSRGSSPDLDVTREVAAAREAHGERANVRALVRAAVKGGHRALGLMPPQVRRGGGADGLVVWC